MLLTPPRGALGHPVFRRLYAAQIVALAGTGLLTVALGLLAYDLAGSAAGGVLGTVLAIKMLAYVFVAPVMSALTERLPRKTVLITADLTRAGVAVLLPFVGEVWQIFVLVFLLQAASATFTPAFQAVIPAVLVDERDYTRALTLSRLAYDLEALASPVLAAALLTVLSYSSLFVATVAGFVVSACLVARTSVPEVPADGAPWGRRLLSGLRIMVTDNDLRALIAMNIAVAAATGLVMVNTVIYVRDLLGAGEAAVAILLAAYGAGSMLLALSMPRLLAVHTDRSVMLAGAALAAGGLLLTAATLTSGVPGWWSLAATWVLLGAATAMVNTPTGRLLRRAGDQTHRTAVFTAQFSLSHAGYLLTYPIAGWVGATVDQGLAAVVLAIVACIAVLAAAGIIARERGGSARRPAPHPAQLRP